tara:strand:- start:72 stop:425 length:354 start_codon:yes stop_codon:yes gene_type:complete
MKELYQRSCEPCGLGAPVVTQEEANSLSLSVPAWKREFHDGVEKLVREFHFIDFRDAFSFTYKVASLAERGDHHPTIKTEWGKVTVYWWTHQINGLHVNDFIMAAKTDLIAKLSAPG